MNGIVQRLDDPEAKYLAVLYLHSYILRLLAECGREGFAEDSVNPKTAAALADTPPLLARMLRVSCGPLPPFAACSPGPVGDLPAPPHRPGARQDAPGNLYAMVVLGLQQFAGDAVLSDKVKNLKAIPPTFDGASVCRRPCVRAASGLRCCDEDPRLLSRLAWSHVGHAALL